MPFAIGRPLAMSGTSQKAYDFFLSRRGSVAETAREVADVLMDQGYRVLVQDYDFSVSSSFVEAMHEGVKNSRDLIVLYTADYEQSPFTRKEFTSFLAEIGQSPEERHVIVLRCEDVQPRGLFADIILQDLVGITDPDERKRRIIAAAERQAQAASRPPRPFIGVPPRIASFTGRGAEFDLVDQLLVKGTRATITQVVGRAALQGLGGIGKTTLANEYAYRYRDLYAGVCWCLAETRQTLLDSLAGLSTPLNVTSRIGANAEDIARAVLHRLAEQRSPWLLIYDNAPNPSEISTLLPSAGASVLITSRFSDWNEWAGEISLDVLPFEDGVAFVQNRADRTDASGARVLVETLGALPLALDHSAAYCRRTQMSFADYATKATALLTVAPVGTGYPRSVAATFDLSIAEASKRNAAAAELMTVLAYCAPAFIPIHVLETAFESMDIRSTIGVLAELSLIKHTPLRDGAPALTVHRLVQAVARQKAQTEGTAKAAMSRLHAALSKGVPARTGGGVFQGLRSFLSHMHLFAHQHHLRRYEWAYLATEYEGLAERQEQLASRLEAAGKNDQAAEWRSNRLLKKSSRVWR